MEKELKRLVVEILTLTLLLIVVVPICVNASNKYNTQKDVLLNGTNTTVDISHNGEFKKITIYSNHDELMKVNLILKINNFSNDYEIFLDGQTYDINDFEYVQDNDYRYYKLGIYEVDRSRELDFKLSVKDNSYYDETITYSFITEGIL